MSAPADLKKAIKDYWEDPDTVSIIDKNLHELEIETASRYLLFSDYLADIGCGDAQATLRYAAKVHQCVGFERSEYLRKKATEAATKSGLRNIIIKSGDILEMINLPEKFDVIVTQRVLINLVSWEEQKQALINIYNALKPGGRYIMIENTEDAFLALNQMRAEVKLESIPKHWHNLFLDYEKLMAFLEGKFQLVDFHDFGLYYFLTRVYVQIFAMFKGYGKNALGDPLFEKSDAAARTIFEKFHNRIKISGPRALGPIQAFIFQRKPKEA